LISVVDEPKLGLSARWRTRPRYSTLSHYWGSEAFLKLTTDNFNDFLKGISTKDLPKTIRDAIYIARKLCVEYIWIDSLCIVQDDDDNADDWRREAGLLSSMYSGTYVNITAASAKNAHEECFLKKSNSVNDMRVRVTVGAESLIRQFYYALLYERSLIQSHLVTREWCL
jgi:hypothetical protein